MVGSTALTWGVTPKQDSGGTHGWALITHRHLRYQHRRMRCHSSTPEHRWKSHLTAREASGRIRAQPCIPPLSCLGVTPPSRQSSPPRQHSPHHGSQSSHRSTVRSATASSTTSTSAQPSESCQRIRRSAGSRQGNGAGGVGGIIKQCSATSRPDAGLYAKVFPKEYMCS